MNAPVSNFMTKSPYTIGKAASLAAARELMNSHQVRHLPVLDGGRLVGLVSIRDIELIESLQDTEASEVPVEEAMTTDVLTFEPDTPLAHVVRSMAIRKAGSALIEYQGRVVGIFTTVDALNVLAEALLPESHLMVQ